ncbi:hypothetical protein C1I92_30285 [Jiangella anatolica]|uniref:Uncharacterized protein n=1 Tax=Jiangella anatolica TaxID=2670374 RepID=A0A2W2BH23_9ACTN|nr:hypothetical protein C1I92_30285 [Jiangella anatolica]
MRSAIEGLLRTCVDLERQTEAAAAELPARVHRVTGQLAGVRLPPQVLDVAGLVQSVDGLGRQLEADLRERLADARQPYVAEIHALLGLLAPWHGVAALPPLVPATPDGDLRSHFPPGFARGYVDDLLATADTSRHLEPADALLVPVPSTDDMTAAWQAIREAFADAYAADGMALLTGSGCHAMQRHGPHITDKAQLARLLCLKDPAGDDTWQIVPSAEVSSGHRCGPVSGGFTSPRAMVRPLEAVLAAAGQRPGGIQELLDDNTASKAKAIALHVSAEVAGLRPGDASGYRGTGTTTRAMRDDWTAAREYGLAHGQVTVHGVPYDPLAAGDDPGVLIVFRRKKAGAPWRLVTYFPVDKPRPDTKRLEDLT